MFYFKEFEATKDPVDFLQLNPNLAA